MLTKIHIRSACIMSCLVHTERVAFGPTKCYIVLQARQRALGNIQFIGHLYRKKMLTEKIMHECIRKLLAEVEAPKQEDLECLAKLMSTVGRQLDANPKAKPHMDAYFDRVAKLGKNMSLESRIRFMLQAGHPFSSRCNCRSDP